MMEKMNDEGKGCSVSSPLFSMRGIRACFRACESASFFDEGGLLREQAGIHDRRISVCFIARLSSHVRLELSKSNFIF